MTHLYKATPRHSTPTHRTYPTPPRNTSDGGKTSTDPFIYTAYCSRCPCHFISWGHHETAAILWSPTTPRATQSHGEGRTRCPNRGAVAHPDASQLRHCPLLHPRIKLPTIPRRSRIPSSPHCTTERGQRQPPAAHRRHYTTSSQDRGPNTT